MPFKKREEQLSLTGAGGESYPKAMDAALKLLSYRQRTGREMELRLLKKGFEKETVNKVCRRLIEIGYLDDQQFAISWIRAHSGSKCRSAWLLTKELRSKGVNPALAEQVIEEVYSEEEVF